MGQKKASRPAELGQMLGKLRKSSVFFLTHKPTYILLIVN
jgi:hypothetical protein